MFEYGDWDYRMRPDWPYPSSTDGWGKCDVCMVHSMLNDFGECAICEARVRITARAFNVQLSRAWGNI